MFLKTISTLAARAASATHMAKANSLIQTPGALSALTIDVVVIDATMTVHDSVTTTATATTTSTAVSTAISTTTAISTYTPSFTPSSTSASSPSSTLGSFDMLASDIAATRGQLLNGPWSQSSVTGGTIAAIAIFLLIFTLAFCYAVWGPLDKTEKWFRCIFGRCKTNTNRDKTNEGQGENGRTQSLSRGMELPTMPNTTPASSPASSRPNSVNSAYSSNSFQDIDLERGSVELEATMPTTLEDERLTSSPSGAPSSPSAAASAVSASTITPDPTLRWPFYPGMKNPPPQPTLPENQTVVDALAEDYGIDTAQVAQVVGPSSSTPPATVVNVSNANGNNSGLQRSNSNASTDSTRSTDSNLSNTSSSGPAQYRDLTARKPTDNGENRNSLESFTASVGGASEGEQSDQE